MSKLYRKMEREVEHIQLKCYEEMDELNEKVNTFMALEEEKFINYKNKLDEDYRNSLIETKRYLVDKVDKILKKKRIYNKFAKDIVEEAFK